MKSNPIAAATGRDEVTAVILAGGLGRRMSADGCGIDKGMVPFLGRPLVQHVIERVAPQISTLLLNVDPSLKAWHRFGLEFCPDRIAGRPGPLAGIHAALIAAQTPWLLSVPCDTPHLPLDLLARLIEVQRSSGADRVSVRCGTQAHPVIALVHRSVAPGLEAYLAGGGRRIESWLAEGLWAEALFDDALAFANLNTADELAQLENPR